MEEKGKANNEHKDEQVEWKYQNSDNFYAAHITHDIETEHKQIPKVVPKATHATKLTHLTAPATGSTAGTIAAAAGITTAAELGNAKKNDHAQHCRGGNAQ